MNLNKRLAGLAAMPLLWSWAFILLMMALSGYLLMTSYVNWDVLHVIQLSKKLYAGGSYTKDFFDNNPPLIFMLSLIPIYLANLLKQDVAVVYEVTTFLMALGSLLVCYFLIWRTRVDTVFQACLLITLAYIFFLLPGPGFAEREHLTVLFSFPYFFAIASSFYSRPLNALLRFVIGVIAGVGLSLKPFFFVSLALVELYLIVKRKSIKTLWRSELFGVIFSIITYLVLVEIYTPDFIRVILPFVMSFYFNVSFRPLVYYFVNTKILYAVIVLMAGYLSRRKLAYSEYAAIFSLACIGFIFCFVIQRKGWYYQMIPFCAAALIVNAVLIHHWYSHFHKSLKIKYLLCVFSTILLALLLVVQLSFMNWNGRRICINSNCPYNKLIHSLTKHGIVNKPIFFFSHNVSFSAVALYYTQNYPGTRTTNLWFVPGWMQKNEQQKKQLAEKKQQLEQFIVDDFRRYKPAAVFVDVNKCPLYTRQCNISYLSFMQGNKDFAEIWKQYQYIETFTDNGNRYAYALYLKKPR